MMYTIHVGDAVLAEFDLQALYQRETTPLQVGTLSPCPACDRVWALPDEDELADMQAREAAQKHTFS